MSGQQHEKTRERAPANLGIKFNPALGAANLKRFHATVRALLKSNQESGELALAVLEGRADSSKESLVQFEPRATDYAKVVAVLKDTKDEAKALAAGKAKARSVEDVKPDALPVEFCLPLTASQIDAFTNQDHLHCPKAKAHVV